MPASLGRAPPSMESCPPRRSASLRSTTETPADLPAGGRRVLLAAPRGYCAGVDRAVITVEKALELYGAPVYVRKQIVHNKHVVADARGARRGVRRRDRRGARGRHCRVLRPRRRRRRCTTEAAAAALQTIDATCPLVTKVHKEARRFAARRLRHPAHRPRGPRGGRGHRRARRPTHIHLVERSRTTSTQVDGPRPGRRSSWLSQTTLSVDETMETVAALRERFPPLQDPPQRRHLLRHPEPPGGGQGDRRRSRPGHRRRLGATPPTPSGWSRSRWTRAPGRLPRRLTRPRSTRPGSTGSTTVGVTSGASVPEILVADVLACLAERGFATSRRSARPRRPAVRAAAGAASRPEGRQPRRLTSPGAFARANLSNPV